jgi:pimeloyl-ACP methyl ester carboxylesterase
VINVVDVTRELVSCPVPILYIQAIRDYIVPASNLAKIQALKPNIEVARVEAPHTILQTQPLRSAQLIAEFANAHATI